MGIVPGMLHAKEIGVNLQPFVDFGPLAGGNLYLTLSPGGGTRRKIG